MLLYTKQSTKNVSVLKYLLMSVVEALLGNTNKKIGIIPKIDRIL